MRRGCVARLPAFDETADRMLPSSFFDRPVLEVAPDLLGTVLCCNGREAVIFEVEAYDGPEDLACHGRFGKTKRTEVMFGPAGRWYVYLCYGMHWMLNIVTGPEDYPAAVLIRGAGEWDGPGKLTRALGIDRSYNGTIAGRATGLWIEDRGTRVPPTAMRRTARVGVEYAGAWARKPYRFVYE